MASKTCLLIDIGNSNVGWKIDNDYSSVNIKDFQPSAIPRHQFSVIACVSNHQLIQHFSNPTIIKPKPYKGLIFDYNLEQLGVDRFLGLVAGYEKYPEQDFMLVDIGTFVTIDMVQNNCHVDGGIAPGLEHLQMSKTFTGNDSRQSWQLGTENMLRDTIEKRCDAFNGLILITGGGQAIVDIKQAEYHQNLVITGLETINGK
ncbi:MAG: type III pantothenate kinase [Gammaproteobacteria bacterium]|nr:type III pantothenate kinase [Gammaproteobacteria bacterium]